MAVRIFNNDTNQLTENSINDSYAMYLHKFIGTCSEDINAKNEESCAIMTYDEFKEYYILKVLGRSAEFTQNIARDYQYLSFGNWTQMPA